MAARSSLRECLHAPASPPAAPPPANPASHLTPRFADLSFKWFAQLRHLTAMHVAIRAAMGAEFAGRAWDCSAGLPLSLLGAISQLMPNVQIFRAGGFVRELLQHPGPSCLVKGDSVIQFFGVAPDFWPAAGLLLGYLWVLHALMLAALVLVARREGR
jgi:hypothetical protein